MIELLISGRKEEREYLGRRIRQYAAKFSEEQFKIYDCTGNQEVKKLLAEKKMLDMVYLDITLSEGIELAKRMRVENKKAYMVLIADITISPMVYMRPSIRAEGLLLRPFGGIQADRVLKESLKEFLSRFQEDTENQFFILENRQGRRLVEYGRIFYFEAREKRLYLVTESEELVFYGSLETTERQLPEYFVKSHRSFLVNSHFVERIVWAENLIYLKGGFVVPLSRSNRKLWKELGT